MRGRTAKREMGEGGEGDGRKGAGGGRQRGGKWDNIIQVLLKTSLSCKGTEH